MKTKFVFITLFVLLALFASSFDSQPTASAQAKAIHVDLSKERLGHESGRFLAVVGNWSIVEDGARKVLAVDGRRWLRGQPAGGLAEKARAIYGARNEEFIDNVKAFAYFPYAVAKESDFRNGDISIRFKMVAGQLDEWRILLTETHRHYLTVRFNGMKIRGAGL